MSLAKPDFVLASADKEKEVKVVILAAMGLETRPELVGIDRDLTRALAHILSEGFKTNKDKVTIVANSRVEKYKDSHPDWQSMPAAEIGRHFKADYVIELEIEEIALYEKSSANMLFKGKAAIAVKVIDVNRSDDNLRYEHEYRCEYPRGGPNYADDNDVAQFRQRFLSHVAKGLAWKFMAHPIEDETSMHD
jgi:hypothetical protein